MHRQCGLLFDVFYRHKAHVGPAYRFADRFCVGHVGPEAALGGPIALLRDGDTIVLDAEKGTLDVELNQSELAERKKEWKARPIPFRSGALWKYANEVGPARTGAVTHPGGSVEAACYADV